jgi:predicted dehydrogenase
MRVVVIGYGVQGKKRFRFAGADAVGVVEPLGEAPEIRWKDIREVPHELYDAAILCVPDEAKPPIVKFLIQAGKHILTEKPFYCSSEQELIDLEQAARQSGSILKTAYNHRFEPHFVAMRKLINSRKLAKIYRCRMFYGNGTARLVRESAWRDKNAGVLPDLGSHLLDTLRFWFGDIPDNFRIISANRFENKSPDHVVIGSTGLDFNIELEMTLLSWRNHFTCDIFAENGSAHIESLCKWGPSKFTYRKRIFPSGRPIEEAVELVQDDPTWELEYSSFKAMVTANQPTDLSDDLWLHKTLHRLSAEVA